MLFTASAMALQTLSSFATGNVTLAWDPNPAPGIAGYRLYYGTSSGNYGTVLAAGTATTSTASNLTEGATYYFAATAYDTNAIESDFSTEVIYTVPITSSNRAPTLNPLVNVSINESAPLQTVNLAGISSGATNENQTLTVTATSSNPGLIPNPAVLYTSPNATGSITFTPVPLLFGTATITVTVNDGGLSNNIISRQFTVAVNNVNQAPTLNTLANVTVNEDAPQQTVNLSGITSGATNETQTLTVTATSSNPTLVANPSVTYSSPSTAGSLAFTPAANGSGSTTITVTVDDGGAANNVITRTFTVTVNSVNDVPTLDTLANTTINENASQQTVNLTGISSGAANENQTLTVTATSSNPGLIPNPAVTYSSPGANGSIAFTPVPFGAGSATISVTVNDGGSSNNVVTRTFSVTVSPVNQTPTLSTLADVTINENASQQTVNLAGISSGATNENQTLTVTATSSNPGLIPTPTVTYTSPNTTGALGFTPAAFASGSSTITVTVNDGGASNNIVTRTFNVTVNGVNQAPTLNPLANVTINEDAPLQTVNLAGITSGASNEIQTLLVSATSSNPSLIPNPAVTYTSPSGTGSLAFTPAGNGFGTATITVTVDDGGISNNIITRTFTVTVNPVNDVPTLGTLANMTISENAPQQTVNLAGIGSGAANETQTLIVTASSSNPGLIPSPVVTYTSPAATGSIRFTPVTGTFGSADITVTVNDGATSNNIVSHTFTVTVDQVNNPPTITSMTNQVIAINTATAALPFTIGDSESSAASLTVSGSSDNQTLVSTGNFTFGGSGANRTVRVTPIAGQTGNANITVTVSDGTDTTSTSFQLSVRARPSAPTNLHVTSN